MTSLVASFTHKHANQSIIQHIDPTSSKQPRSTCVHERYDSLNKKATWLTARKENSRKTLGSRASPVWDKLTARAVRETPTLFMSVRAAGGRYRDVKHNFSR